MVRDTLTLDASAKISVRNLNIWYGDHHAIIDNSMTIRKNNVTALIGPSGCGKSTFLRALNRMNDFIDDCVTKGSVDIDGTYHKAYNLLGLNNSSSYEGTNQTETGEFDIMFNVRSLGGNRAANASYDVMFCDNTDGLSGIVGSNINMTSVNSGDANAFTVWGMRYGTVDATGFKLEAGGSAGGDIASGKFFMYGLKYA